MGLSISRSCIADVAGDHNYGMSQRGAIRWAKGNTCPEGTGAAWPVEWDHQQILVHYYTGIDIVDDGNGNKVAPNYRWNPLQSDIPRVMQRDTSQRISVQIQNTGTIDWIYSTGVYYSLYYWWTDDYGHSTPRTYAISVIPLLIGESNSYSFEVTMPNLGTGEYTLHFDLKRHTDWGESLFFGEQSIYWPIYSVRIVTATGIVYLPLITKEDVAR